MKWHTNWKLKRKNTNTHTPGQLIKFSKRHGIFIIIIVVVFVLCVDEHGINDQRQWMFSFIYGGGPLPICFGWLMLMRMQIANVLSSFLWLLLSKPGWNRWYKMLCWPDKYTRTNSSRINRFKPIQIDAIDW